MVLAQHPATPTQKMIYDSNLNAVIQHLAGGDWYYFTNTLLQKLSDRRLTLSPTVIFYHD